MNDMNLNENEPKPKTRRGFYHGSLFWPLLLITVGVVFLLRNLGGMESDTFGTLLKLWPVLLIAMGLDGLLQGHGVAGATFWIGIGVIFLLSNFGQVDWNVWELILRLWPLLIIAIGIDIVLGHRSAWGALVALVLMLAIFGGALLLVQVNTPAIAKDISQPVGNATQATIHLSPAVGSMHVKASTDPNQLVEGVVYVRDRDHLTPDFSKKGNQAEFTLKTENYEFLSPAGGWSNRGWELGLTPKIPLELDVDMGVGDLDLDLSGLQLSRVKVDIGVGTTTLLLPEEGRFSADLDCGVGQIVIIVPEGMEVKIVADTGVAFTQAPSGFHHNGDTYTTAGYTLTATHRAEIKVDLGVGKVTLKFAK